MLTRGRRSAFPTLAGWEFLHTAWRGDEGDLKQLRWDPQPSHSAKEVPPNGTRNFCSEREWLIYDSKRALKQVFPSRTFHEARPTMLSGQAVRRASSAAWATCLRLILHHLRNPGTIRFSCKYQQTSWFPLLSKWFEIDFATIHSMRFLLQSRAPPEGA